MKIIQLLLTPNDAAWQGSLLGLADDGGTYRVGTSGQWEPMVAPIQTEKEDAALAATPPAPSAMAEGAREWDALRHRIERMHNNALNDFTSTHQYSAGVKWAAKEILGWLDADEPVREVVEAGAGEQEAFRYFRSKKNTNFQWRVREDGKVQYNTIRNPGHWNHHEEPASQFTNADPADVIYECREDGTPLPSVPEGVPKLEGEFADFEYWPHYPKPLFVSSNTLTRDLIICRPEDSTWDDTAWCDCLGWHGAIRRGTELHRANFIGRTSRRAGYEANPSARPSAPRAGPVLADRWDGADGLPAGDRARDAPIPRP